MVETQFVDVEKAKKDMETFAAINEQRLYKLYKVCVDVHSDLQSLVKSRVSFPNAFLQKLTSSTSCDAVWNNTTRISSIHSPPSSMQDHGISLINHPSLPSYPLFKRHRKVLKEN